MIIGSALTCVTIIVAIPFSTKPSGVRPPVWRTAARAKGITSSMDFAGRKYPGNRGGGYLVFSAPDTRDARLKHTITMIRAIVFTTAPPLFSYCDSREYFFIFFCSNLSTLFNFLELLRNLET